MCDGCGCDKPAASDDNMRRASGWHVHADGTAHRHDHAHGHSQHHQYAPANKRAPPRPESEKDRDGA